MIEALMVVLIVALVWGFSSTRAAVLRGPKVVSDNELKRNKAQANAVEHDRFRHNEGREYGDKGQYTLNNAQLRRIKKDW